MAKLTGVAFEDFNGNGILDKGEATAGIRISAPSGRRQTNVDGEYSMFASTGVTKMVWDEGPIQDIIKIDVTIGQTDAMVNLINTNIVETNASVRVTGQVQTIIGTGTNGLTLEGDAHDQTIKGTSGNDTLLGQGGNDYLAGNGGNDNIFGGDGFDVAVFNGSLSQFGVTQVNDQFIVSGNGQGTDKTTSVEVLRFSDGDYYYDQISGKIRAFDDITTGAPRLFIAQEAYGAQATVRLEGNVFNDKNLNGINDPGEGIEDVQVIDGGIGTQTDADGSYRKLIYAGYKNFEYQGPGLLGKTVVTTSLTSGTFALDILNGTELTINTSAKIEGEIFKIMGTGTSGLTLIGDYRGQEIVGTVGNDTLGGEGGGDILVGGLGNDRLVGGEGIDVAVFSGDASKFTVSLEAGAIVVSGNGQGTDKTWGVEVFRFDNGDYHYDAAYGFLVPFGPNAGAPLANSGPPNENEAPTVASSQQVSTSASQAVAFTVSASDPDGDTLNYTPSQAAHGVVTGSAGSFTYTPNANYTGNDSFTVVVSDGNGGTAVQTVSVTVYAANEAPTVTAPSQTITTKFQTTVNITVSASDPDGDQLSYSPSNPANGSVSVGLGGAMIYTPKAGFSGTDNFTVVVSDGRGGTATQAVSIEVEEPNTPPVTANSQTAKTVAGETVAILIEASDADGDALNFTIGAAGSGTVVDQGNGLLYYTPNAGFTGNDDFAVTVDDGRGGASHLTVTVKTYETAEALMADQPVEFEISMPDGFKGMIGGAGNVFGSQGFQHIVLPDAADYLAFDPSFNNGGDVIEFPNAAADYIIALEGSTAVIKDGDSTYVLPLGPTPTIMLFSDGPRELGIDQTSGQVLIGGQVVTGQAAIIDAAPDQALPPQAVDPQAFSVLTLAHFADLPLMGNFEVFGTSAAQTLDFFGGKLNLDTSFNQGGDLIILHKSAFEYSAYINGSNLMLVSGDDMISIPLGTAGIRLDFNGDERIALIDPEIQGVTIGDQLISATNANDAESLGGGLSLDLGAPTAVATIDLDAGVAYALFEDPGLASFVQINGFDEDDQIVLLAGDVSDYSFSATGSAIQISSNDGSVVNQITLNGVEANGFVYDAASAINAVGWNFITVG
ncbi:MAG: tandem-95 repeat protein [Sphingomonadaceae bacterium]